MGQVVTGRLVCDLWSALEGFAQNGALHFDLDPVGCVLIVAATALAKVRAWRLGARGTRFEDGLQLRGREAAFVGDDFRFDRFAREGEGDEDGFAIGAGQT